MSMTRKYILALLFIGFAGNVSGNGTFASFNASTSNSTSQFATGSIVLTNQRTGGTAGNSANVCFSNGTTANAAGASTDANNNTLCDLLFNTATKKPGETATADITLTNVGTLGGTLKLLVASHTPTVAPLTPQTACSNRNVGTYSGTGDLCQKLQLRVQRYTTAGRTIAYTTAPGGCVYGTDGNADDLCDTGVTGKNLKDFSETSLAASTGISLGDLSASGGGSDVVYLRVTVDFADGGVGADNAFQGRVAGFAMKWQIDQL